MKEIIRRVGGMGAAVAAVASLAGCGLSDVGEPPGRPAASHPVTLTQYVAPSALVTVARGPESGPAVSGLVPATARPSEDLTILQVGAPGKTITASASPAPPRMIVPGPPVAPSGGETSYQAALYARQLKHWRAELASERQAYATQIRGLVAAWLRGLRLREKMSELSDPPEDRDNLAAEGAVAASALAGLEEESGNIFGPRRVVVLYCDDLSGALPAGELEGDDVIVITSFLPAEAAATAAQADLLAAGAAQAAVVGPEVTGAQLAELVSAGLSQNAMTESVSAPVLFANNSAALMPRAIRELTRLLGRLRREGVTAVINGYTSTQGTAATNYVLSYLRAAAVAYFFESRGIPESSLIIVGHGASDPIGSGASGANRRVTVVVEQTPSRS